MNENQDNMAKMAIKYGAIFSVISFIIQLVLYAVNYELLVSFIYIIILIVILLGAMVWAGIQYRKSVGGYLSYGKSYVFLIILTVSLFSIGAVFSWVLYNVVDPELPAMVKEIQIDSTIEFMENMNAPDDKIDEAIAEIESQNAGGVLETLKASMVMIIVFAVLDLLLALFVRKSRPEFE